MKSKKNYYKLDVEDIQNDDLTRENSATSMIKKLVFADQSIPNMKEELADKFKIFESKRNFSIRSIGKSL